MAWQWPSWDSDPGSCWINELQACDGDTDTTARSTPFCNGWLVFTLFGTIASSIVRIWTGDLVGLWALVGVYDTDISSWVQIKNGNITNAEELPFATRNISHVRFRGNSTWGDIISDIRVWENEITTSTSTSTTSTSTTITSITSTTTTTVTSTTTTTTLHTDAELAAMFPQHTRLHLGIRQGTVLWSAVVNQASFEPGQREITYDGASGTPNILDYHAPYLVLRNPTVDSTYGQVKGYAKISSFTPASPTAGVVTVENNSLPWADDDVLHIRDFIPLYARRGAHDSWPGWQVPYPVPIMGSQRMGYVNDNLEFMAEDSYGLKTRTVASYYWIFHGGRVVGQAGVPYDRTTVCGTRDDPLLVYWTAAGEYLVELTVRDSGGAQYTSYRSVLIYDRTGDDAPHDWISLRSIDADWESGGATCQIEVYRSPTLANFPDHALAILIAEEWYGDYKHALGDELGAEDHLFVGYIVANSQTLDADTETVSLEIASIDYLMDRLNVWPEQFKDDDSPSGWTEFTNLTLDDIAWHVLRQHSTIPETHDIHSEITTRIDAMDVNEAPLLSVLNEQIFSVRFGKCASTRLSNLYLTQDRQYQDRATQEGHAFAMTIGIQRWFDTLDIGEERAPDQVSQMELEAFTRELIPVLSDSPSLDPSYPSEGTWGVFEKMSGILVEDVEEAEYLAGQALAVANQRYSRLSIQTANWRAVSPARQDYIKLDMAAGVTLRGHDWSSERIICRGISWQSEPTQIIEGEPIVQGVDGGYVALDPALAPDQTLGFVTIVVQVGANDIRAFFTSSISDADPSWTEFSTSLNTDRLYDLNWDPFNKYQMFYIGSYNGVWRWEAPLGMEAKWKNILTLAEFDALIPSSPSWYAAVRIETSERKQGYMAVLVVYPHPDDASYLQARVAQSLDWGADWTVSSAFTYSVNGNSRLYHPGLDHLCQFDLSGDRHASGNLYVVLGMINPAAWKSILYMSTGHTTSFSQIGLVRNAPTQPYSRGAVLIPYADYSGSDILYWSESSESGAGFPPRVGKSSDGGATFANVGGLSVLPQTLRHPRVLKAHEQNPQRVMVYQSYAGASGVWVTTDGGTNWTFMQITNGVAGSEIGQGVLYDVIYWAPDEDYMLACGDSFIRVSSDGGNSWSAKNGDLADTLGESSFKVLAVRAYW